MPPSLVIPSETPTPPTFCVPPNVVGWPSTSTDRPSATRSMIEHGSAAAAVAAGVFRGAAIFATDTDIALSRRERAFVHERPTRRERGAARFPDRVLKPS